MDLKSASEEKTNSGCEKKHSHYKSLIITRIFVPFPKGKQKTDLQSFIFLHYITFRGSTIFWLLQ